MPIVSRTHADGEPRSLEAPQIPARPEEALRTPTLEELIARQIASTQAALDHVEAYLASLGQR